MSHIKPLLIAALALLLLVTNPQAQTTDQRVTALELAMSTLLLPGTPTTPSPANNATGLASGTIVLSWADVNATSYDVRFGTIGQVTLSPTVTSANVDLLRPTSPVVTATVTSPTYTVTSVVAGHYYWRVTAKNIKGTTTSVLWNFTVSENCTTTVTAGTTAINTLVQAQANGATICFPSGTFSPDATIEAKPNQLLVGHSTILDGHSTIAKGIHGYGGNFGYSIQHVTVSGFEIKNYTDIGLDTGWYWTVSNVDTHNNNIGMSVNTGGVYTANHIHHNAQYGITGGPADNVLLLSNELDHNNTGSFCGGGCTGDAGGSKIVGSTPGTTGLIWRSNNVHDNTGMGIWSDGNVKALYENNTVTANSEGGIFHELSWDATIRNNTLTNNAVTVAGSSCFYGANIHVNTSSNVDIYSNTIIASNGTNGVCIAASNRSDAVSPYPTDTTNVTVHNNVIKINGSAQNGLVLDVGESIVGTGFSVNSYFVPTLGGTWWVWPAHNPATWTQWQADGQDTAGTHVTW